MALSNYYNIGTVSVPNNSTALVGVGTIWNSYIRSGDIFEHNGLTVRVATVIDNTRITLAEVWPGTDIVDGTYEIRIPPPSSDITADLRALVQALANDSITDLGGITFVSGDFIQFNGTNLTNVTPTSVATTLSSVLIFGTGSAGTPSIRFTSDTDTGIYNPSANKVGIVGGGNILANFSSSGFGLRSSGAAFDLLLKTTEALTADRAITISVGDAARTLALTGNLSFGGAVTTGGAFTTSGAYALTFTLSNTTTVTLPTTGTLSTLAGSETLTNKTFNASNNTLSNITTAMFASNVIDTDATLSANSTSRIPAQSAVKSYVDNYLTGLQWKTAVICATTANITLSGEQTIDGILTSASRVLVKNQGTGTQNGIYVSASGSWTRAIDMDVAAEFPSATTFIESGTINGDTQWTCTNDSVTVGSTSVVFAQVSGSGTYSAGTGVTLTGNQFSIANNAITYALFQQVAASSLVGNATGSLANATGITLGSTLAFSGSALQTVAHTGDVTTSANSFATTVAKIQTTTVSGTTGSVNVVFSTSPSITSPTISGGTIGGLTSFGIRSTGAAFDLKIANTEVLTANRTLTFQLYDANHTVFLGGNLAINSNDISFNTSGSTTVTLPTTGTLSTLAGSETLTNKSISALSNTITNLDTTMFASGVFDTDITLAANSSTKIPAQSAVKSYIDSAVQGLSWKAPVYVATTGPITLLGEQTIDGFLTSGSRVLVKDQATQSQNGIYISGLVGWTRSTDADTGNEIVFSTCLVENGTVNQGVVFTCNVPSITLGTTSIVYVAAGVQTASLSPGTGLSLSGSTMSISNNGVTYALFQTMAANTLHGNPTGSTATTQAITLGASLAFVSTALQTVAFTGDVTTSANSFATTVAKIQTTTVSGTTGSGNVVFSVSPTLTGTLTATNITMSGTLTQGGSITAAFGTTGVGYVGTAFTQTDNTTGVGTVATVYASVQNAVTFTTTTNAVTITNAYGDYFKDPVAGTHVTLTNKWALGADSLNVTGNFKLGGTFSGSIPLSSIPTNGGGTTAQTSDTGSFSISTPGATSSNVTLPSNTGGFVIINDSGSFGGGTSFFIYSNDAGFCAGAQIYIQASGAGTTNIQSVNSTSTGFTVTAKAGASCTCNFTIIRC